MEGQEDPLEKMLQPEAQPIRYGQAVCFRAIETGRCLDVANAKVSARWFDRGDWQTFLLCPSASAAQEGAATGAFLHDGDTVRLLAHTGACLAVSNTGKVVCRPGSRVCTELVVRLKASQRRVVRHKDEIYLQCRSTGRVLDVEGTKVAARFQHCGDWQTLSIECQPAPGVCLDKLQEGRTIVHDDTVRLRAAKRSAEVAGLDALEEA